MDGKTIYAMQDVRYTTEIDEDDDVRKISHMAVLPDGTIKHIAFSPYSYMNSSSFRTWVRLGMPTPSEFGRAGNFTNDFFDNAIAVAEEHNIDVADPDQRDMLKVALKLRTA